MKTYLFAGLAILLPLVLTAIIVLFFLRLLTQPFVGTAEGLLSYYGFQIPPFWFFSGKEILRLICQLIVLFGLFFFTILIGTMAESIVGKKLFFYTNKLFHFIPMVNKIYKACSEVIHTLFGPKKQYFGTVVLIPFPHKGMMSIGLVTHEALVEDSFGNQNSGLISVFLPTTPNPMMGFLLLFPRDELIFTQMSVEEGLRSIISCGVMIPEIKADLSFPISET